MITLGGDGTVNEAANGLAGSDVPLFPLPGGSQNVYAKMLGIPGDIVDATQQLLRIADAWRRGASTSAASKGRLFTFSAGAGLDASVVERVDANPRAQGALARALLRRQRGASLPAPLHRAPAADPVETKGSSVRGVTVIVQNGDPYTYFGERPIRVCEGIGLDDGTLSAAVLERASPVDLPTMGARLLADNLEVTDHSHAGSLPGLDGLRCPRRRRRAVRRPGRRRLPRPLRPRALRGRAGRADRRQLDRVAAAQHDERLDFRR